MASPSTSTALQQLNAHPVLNAIPANFALSPPDCGTYKTYRPILAAAIPIITTLVPKAGAALTFLMKLADGVCGVSAQDDAAAGDNRRQVASQILDMAAADPQWRAQLLADPNAALVAGGFGSEAQALRASGALGDTADCSFSCIIST